MTTRPLLLFPDTTVVINFALCDAMDLLERLMASRGRWCAGVAAECDHRAAEDGLPEMLKAHDIFGVPLRPESPREHMAVRMNQDYFLKPGDGRRMHLGESETLAILTERGLHARFFTDDTHVPRRAKSQGVICLTTWDLLRVALLGDYVTADQVREYRRILLNHRRVHLAHIRDPQRFEEWLAR